MPGYGIIYYVSLYFSHSFLILQRSFINEELFILRYLIIVFNMSSVNGIITLSGAKP